MQLHFALFSALYSAVLAQDVVTAYLNGLSDMNQFGSGLNFTPVVSIEAVSKSTTVMSLGCGPNTPKRACVVGDGMNYTIISDSTYIGAFTMTDLVTMSMGFTCVHSSAASKVMCAEENQGEEGFGAKNTMYDAVPGDFVTASIVGGKEKLRTTAVSASTTATPASIGATGSAATVTPTGTSVLVQSTGDASRPAVVGSLSFALAGAALLAAW